MYPDKTAAEKPTLQVEFRVDGQVVASQTAELPPPDASGVIPMMIRAATRAGACELKITAVQGVATPPPAASATASKSSGSAGIGE